MSKRGETTLTDSAGQAYIVRFGTNAICETQQQLKKPFGAILKDLDPQAFDLLTIRTMVKCALVHPKEATDAEIGDLIDDVGMDVIADAISKVFKTGGTNGGPPGLPSGDGSALSASPSASTPTDSTH